MERTTGCRAGRGGPDSDLAPLKLLRQADGDLSWYTKQGVLWRRGGALPSGSRAHLHTLLLVLHTVQLVVLVAVLVLAVLQEGDLLQHRAAQALLPVFACCIPAHSRGQSGS